MGPQLLIIYHIIYQSSAPLLHSGAGCNLILTQLCPWVKGTAHGRLLFFDTEHRKAFTPWGEGGCERSEQTDEG